MQQSISPIIARKFSCLDRPEGRDGRRLGAKRGFTTFVSPIGGTSPVSDRDRAAQDDVPEPLAARDTSCCKRVGTPVLALLLGISVLGLPGVCAAVAPTVPADLPRPHNTPPAKDKPVKVYILSGQSNMVGMGELGPQGMTRYDTFVSAEKGAEKGCTLSIYSGAYDPAEDYDKLQPVATDHVMVGYWPHRQFPECKDPCTQIARGFIRIARKGHYNFYSGNILEVDGKVIYRKEPGKDALSERVELEAGVHPITVIHFGRGATNLSYQYWDVPGTLTTLVKQQGKFPNLVDDQGNWTVRRDVIYKGVISSVGQGPLTPGVSGQTFGPELGFGQVMGYYHDAPVLLIKASIGNRSLGWDILPPGSERYTYEGKVYAGYKDSPASWPEGTEPTPINWYAGKTYDRYTAAIHDVLNNFDTLFPEYKDQGYEIAGFVWWQGHKDSGSEAHIQHYEQNLVRLIEAWRKEFKAPKAPWVIATVGFHGDEMPDKFLRILAAQEAVADPKQHPELAGTVATLDTRPFWRGVEASPRPQDYHYNRNAETYYLVGDALGRMMVPLQEGN